MAATMVESVGMFQTADGAVYRVVKSQQGRLYAKRLNTSGGFDYAPSAIKQLTEDDRMTLEAAQAFGRRFGICAYCGRTLTDPASIAAGIGPVCAKGEDGRWSSAERTAAKVALDWDQMEADRKAARAELVEANEAATPEPVEPPKAAGTLTIVDKIATLVSDYDPDAVAAVRSISGRKWDATAKVNTFPVNEATIPALADLVERFGYEVVGELPDPKQIVEAIAARVEASTATDADIEVEGLGGELLAFQKAGVAYAASNGSLLIGDDMGLGKTVQALAALQVRQAFPALIVVPAVVKLNWKREAEKWLPGRKVVVLTGRNGNAEPLASYDIVVINYDIVADRLTELAEIDWQAIVADESHYLKTAKAKRTKAVKQLAKGIEFKIMLTGTAVLNRPVELASQLDILGRLDEFGGFWHFAKRYCAAVNNGYGWDFSGASNLPELHEKLRQTCYIRRTKDQVLTELPAKRRATVPMALSDRAEYDRVEADLRAFIETKVAADADFAALIADLEPDEQADAIAAEVEDRNRRSEQAAILAKINALRQTTARLKLDSVADWIADFQASGRKLVVFGHHREIVDGLANRFGCDSITGATSVEARQAAVDRFQSDPDASLLVCNIAAGGVGITLTAASDVAFVELPWRPGDVDQAEDRCHRIGQHDSVTAWYLLAEDTMDEDMAELLDEKRAVVEATIDGREAASTSIMAGLTAAILSRGE